MGFWIKRILTVDNNSTPEKVKKLAEAFDKCTDFDLYVADDHCDDSNWNHRGGIENGPFGNEYIAIGEEFGEDFTVHCYDESGAIYDELVRVEYDEEDKKYYASVEESIIRESPEWYEANKDGYEKNPGVRKGYYTDYGLGEDYPILYGKDGHIPAGVKWWELPENQECYNGTKFYQATH